MHLEGHIENQNLFNILKEISQNDWSGSLFVKFQFPENPPGEVYLMFAGGKLLTCQEQDQDENLIHELKGFGVLSANQLEESLKISRKKDSRLEEVFIEEGYFREVELKRIYQSILANRLKKFLEPFKGSYFFQFSPLEDEDIALPHLALSNEELYLPGGINISQVFENMHLVNLPKVPSEEIFATLGAPPGMKREYVELNEELGMKGVLGGHLNPDEMSILNSMVHELRNLTDPNDIPLLLLRYGSQIFQRGVLLKVEDSTMRSIGEFGFDLEGKVQEIKFRQKKFPLDATGLISQALREKKLLKQEFHAPPKNFIFFEVLGVPPPKGVFIAPILSREIPNAVLYGDFGPGKSLQPKTLGLEIFLSQIGLALEKKFLQDRIEALEQRSQEI